MRSAAVPIELLPVAVMVCSVDGTTIRKVNRMAADLLGATTDDVVGRPLARVVADPSDHDELTRAFTRACTPDPDAPTEVVVRALTREPRWFRVRLSREADEVIAVVDDVTSSRKIFRVLRESLEAVAVIDEHGERLWGPVGREHPEDRPSEVHGSSMDRVHPEDQAAVVEVWARVYEQPGRRERVRCRVRDVELGERWGKAIIEIANLSHIPEIGGLVVSIRDGEVDHEVTSIGHTTAAYLSVAEAAPVGIVLTGPRGFPIYFNRAVQDLLPGVGPGGAERDWLSRADPAVVDELREWFEGLVAAHESGARTVLFDVDGPGPTWVLLTVAPRRVDDDEVVGFVVTFQDVTGEREIRRQLEDAQARLVHMATHDPLTGLGNRALLDRWLDELPDDAASTTRGLLYVDLDGFKPINDELGHQAGDEVLVEVADRLRRVAPSSALVVRVGGDEFLLILDDASDDALSSLASELLAAIEAPVLLGDREVGVGASVGVASWHRSEPFDDALRRADTAMYTHKSSRQSSR